MSHNVYIHCKKNIKRVYIKIAYRNIAIKATIECKNNEQKGISLIYPIFTNKLKLLHKTGTKITEKTINIKTNTYNPIYSTNLKESTYYKTGFLYNYVVIMLVILLLFSILKILYNMNKKITIITMSMLLTGLIFVFLAIDIYYVDRKIANSNYFAIAYKFFGTTRSTYTLKNNGIYLYPINGKLIIDFNRNKIYTYSKENLYLIYNYNIKNYLILWKNLI